MKVTIAIFLVLGVFLIFNAFIPHRGFVEVVMVIVVIGLAKPLRCPKCLEPETFRILEEDMENMRYQRKCRKCGFVDRYDFLKDEKA